LVGLVWESKQAELICCNCSDHLKKEAGTALHKAPHGLKAILPVSVFNPPVFAVERPVCSHSQTNDAEIISPYFSGYPV